MYIPNRKRGLFLNEKNGGQKYGFPRFLTVLMTVTLFVSTASLTAFAAGNIDAKKECSLELHYQYDGQSLGENSVKLFRVAGVSADGAYTLTGSFSEYRVKVNGVKTQTEWNETAATLASYAAADSIQPEQTAKTDADGTVRFSSLKTGLYLVESEAVTTDERSYIFAPFLISLPNLDDSDSWVFDVSAEPKCEAHYPTHSEIKHKVVKLWNDADYKRHRPESITVDIFKNGEKVSEQVLSEANDWSYSWTSPDDGSVWQAVEREVPEHYTVTVRYENNIIAITNTTTETVPDPKLPQTGDNSHIEFYVLLMALSGTVLLLLGIAKRRSDARGEK